MTICFDLDGTLCSTDVRERRAPYPGGGSIIVGREADYASAQPIWPAIRRVNALFDAGHTIKIWTARGSGSGRDYRRLTEQQLARWGVRYDELSVGEKPVFDYIIDDRAVPAATWLRNGIPDR